MLLPILWVRRDLPPHRCSSERLLTYRAASVLFNIAGAIETNAMHYLVVGSKSRVAMGNFRRANRLTGFDPDVFSGPSAIFYLEAHGNKIADSQKTPWNRFVTAGESRRLGNGEPCS